MFRRRVLPFVVFVFVSTIAFGAQRVIPTLTVEGDDGSVALDLTALKVHVTIRGHLARTELELTYRNSLDRVTEGDFNFPLPPDAEVSDLGLYFDGKLRHGVAVERTLARTAYEETIHRAVDPALAEWTAGRGFRLRVYPIPENGEKSVFIAYDQELTGGDYELDLRYGKTMRFEATIDADGRAVDVSGDLRALRSDGAMIDGVIRVAREQSETAFVARSPEDGAWYASAAIDVGAQPQQMPPAAHIVILYDTSASSVQQDAALLRRFLNSFLEKQQAWSSAAVIPFHVALDPARRVERAGTVAGQRDIERMVAELQPLGATNLIAVANELAASMESFPAGTRVVLVTDGMTSLGNSREVAAAFAKLAGTRRPLLVVHASSTADDQLLANAARATGGWAFDLTRIEPEAAAAIAMRKPVSMRFKGAETFPATITANADARVAVAVRSAHALPELPRAIAARELRDPREASMVRRAWARAKLREMLAHGAPDEAVTAHGLAYAQLTPRTSLLVLESWWDYERYEIPMPPELAAEKAAEIEQARREREESERPIPARVITPAQPDPGVWCLRGTVLTDDAPLPGATVTLFDGTTRLQTDVSDGEGSWAFFASPAPALPRVTAELSGLMTAQHAFDGAIASGTSLQLGMRVASVSEAITVTAAAPTLEVARSAMAAPQQPELRIAKGVPAMPPAELRREVLTKLRSIGSTSERVRYYLSARELLAGDKSFHVFAAETFRERSPEIAARILSDLAESRPEDAAMLRILARVLDGWDQPELARLLLRRAIDISPAEPQSWRELLLLEARQGRTNEVASLIKKLREMKREEWDIKEVFEQAEEAIERWNRTSLLRRERGSEIRFDEHDDLTIELMWDTDWTFVDIHIVEPSGETVTWNHTESKAGAKFTGGYIFGYGPEIYSIRSAPRGDYRVEVDYFASDDTRVSLETLVHVVVYARGQRKEYFTVLSVGQEHYTLATVPVR